MTVAWANGAIADLARIRNYIAEHNPDAANSIARHLLNTAELLASHPQMGVATVMAGVHRLVVPRSVYSLIYRFSEGNIEIIEVFDGRRRRPRTIARTRPE